MLELVLTLCLHADHSRCHEKTITFNEEGLTPYRCMMQSPPQIAEQLQANPKEFVKRWTCRPAGRYAKT
jgi:hypothetical protein